MADIVFVPGYREDKEDRDYLADLSMRFEVSPQFRVGAMRPITRRNWLFAKNQGQIGSCTGWMRRNASMIQNYVDTLAQTGEAEIVELSAMYCYLTNQQECGLLGRDQGATITGALDAAQECGVCRESTMRYPNPAKYSITIPAAAAAEGKLHLTLKHLRPRTVEQVYQWHQTGMGCTFIGVPWTRRMASNSSGVMKLGDITGPSMGGHALCLTGGHSEQHVDGKGRPYFELLNSHGIDWGDDGYCYVEPACVEFWIESRMSEVICVTDIQEGFSPRRPTPEFVSAWDVFPGGTKAQQLKFVSAWGDDE